VLNKRGNNAATISVYPPGETDPVRIISKNVGLAKAFVMESTNNLYVADLDPKPGKKC
jgi:hypothetical protein